MEGDSCYIPSGNVCFLKCINSLLDKYYSAEYYTFLKSFKGQIDVMMRGEIPLSSEGYKSDIGFFVLMNIEEYLRDVLKKIICLYLFKQHHCVIWKNSTTLLKDAEEIENKFHFLRNRIDNKIFKNFKKTPTFRTFNDELNNVLVFDKQNT